MKKTILMCLLIVSVAANAQKNFIVQNLTTSVFSTLQDAYDNCSAGDTLYLPGGSFNMPALEKTLVIIGVGYHPDSTSASLPTQIINPVNLTGTCDNSYLTGMHFLSNVLLGSTDDDATSVIISRCRIGGSLYLKKGDGGERDIDVIVSESIIDNDIYGYKGRNITIEKCFVKGTIKELLASHIDRVIVGLGGSSSSSGYSYCFYYCEDCFVSNSFINYKSYSTWRINEYGCINNDFQNNIFAGNTSFPAGTNTGSNNLTGIDPAVVFENIDGNINTFSYAHDFHLAAGSPAIGAGLSGTDIGIYGGANPFKEGGLPFVPHIRYVMINPETNNGLLQVEIKAVSQEK